MAGPTLVDGLLILGAVAFLIAGLAIADLCDGGGTLILFGVAIALIGALLFRTGAWATVIPMAIVAVTLIGGGWYGATVAGCSL